jgi:arylsulfatase
MNETDNKSPNRRDILLASTALAAASAVALNATTDTAQAQQRPAAPSGPPHHLIL